MTAPKQGRKADLALKLDNDLSLPRAVHGIILNMENPNFYEQIKFRDGLITCQYYGQWTFERDGKVILEGDNGVSLAALLYCTSTPVTFILLAEAATGIYFDEETFAKLETVLQGWLERGSPERSLP